MSDIIKQKQAEEIGMLFLFDVVNSSTIAAKEEQLRNHIFYKKITLITENVVDEINDKQNSETSIIQNTGDGAYLFSKDVDIAMHLWTLLVRQFSFEGIQIHCGAGYGHVSLNGENTGSHLGNVVDRCCSVCDSPGELIITDMLYNLIKDSSYYRSISPKVVPIDKPNLKGCTDVSQIYRLTRSGSQQARAKCTKRKAETAFYGREEVLNACTQLVSDCFSKNQAITILGISGVGKTTLAMSVATHIDLHPICIDLRQVLSLRDLHRAIVDIYFRDLNVYNLTNEALYKDESTLVKIFSKLSSIVLVFDHSELFEMDPQRYAEILNFFPKLQKTSPSLISRDLPQQQGKKRKISQFRWGNGGVGGRERK